MAHEIPWTRKPFFSPGARELNLGRICPFEFEDGFRRQMPEQILLNHFVGSSYEWLFLGSFWERLQTNVPQNENLVWCPKKHSHHPWVQTLALIVHHTVILLKDSALSEDIIFYLHIYYDAHVPLMCALEDSDADDIRTLFREYHPRTQDVLHEGALPDIVHLQLECSFWNENKPKMQPIVHLMCKALPQRCQIRNLREIISNYCKTDDTVHEFMRSALLCSLLGMYRHCKYRPGWEARKKIIRRFLYEKPNRMQLQEWLFTIYQHLLFYIIKEFLTFSMRLVPSLYGELCKTYKWTIFEQTVQSAMDVVRETVGKNIRTSTAIKDWLCQIESSLIQVNKQQLGNLYRPQRQTFTQNVISICNRIDETRHQINPHVEFSEQYRLLLRSMAKRVERGSTCIEWLQYFNISNETINSLMSMYKQYHQNTYRTDLRKLLQSVKRFEFEAIRELFAAFQSTHFDIRVFQLPKHYYEQQCVSLRRRYGLQENEELPDYAGNVYLCLSCNTFKGFCVKDDKKCSNLFANGHQKIIIDDETLKCYCGRRSEKTDTKKRKRIAIESFLDGVELEEHRKRRIKKDWKTARKIMQNDLCAQTECIQFNMTGCLLQFHGKIYLFCPSCGNPTTFCAEQYDKHGFSCGQCLKEGTLYTSVTCYICTTFRGKDAWTTIETIDGNETETLAICNNCYKPWLRQCDQPIPKEIITQQKEKMRERKNPKS